MNWIKRLIRRITFIFRVANQLGADMPSRLKMIIGGIWLLMNDSWKSRIRFTANIRFNDRVSPFFFEEAGDFELLDEVFLNGSYYFSDPITNDGIIIDLGANIGVSSLFFSMKWPSVTIHSVEPDPENFRRLQQTASVLKNMILHNAAVWPEATTIPFYRNRRRGSSSSIHPEGSDIEKIEIGTITLSQLLEQTGAKRVSLVKFDIEGAEEKLFSGFNDFQRIERLAGELHHDLCNTSEFLDKVKKEYNNIDFHPLKEQREYLLARNRKEL